VPSDFELAIIRAAELSFLTDIKECYYHYSYFQCLDRFRTWVFRLLTKIAIYMCKKLNKEGSIWSTEVCIKLVWQAVEGLHATITKSRENLKHYEETWQLDS